MVRKDSPAVRASVAELTIALRDSNVTVRATAAEALGHVVLDAQMAVRWGASRLPDS